MLSKELVDEHRPIGESAAEVHGAVRPVEPVAAAKIDPVDGCAPVLQSLRQTVEQGPWWALQKQEGAIGAHLIQLRQDVGQTSVKPALKAAKLHQNSPF